MSVCGTHKNFWKNRGYVIVEIDRNKESNATMQNPGVATMTRARLRSGAARRGEPGGEPASIAPDPWFLGYATALAQIWRLRGDAPAVRHLLAAGGLTIRHLEWGGALELDLNEISDACLRGNPPPDQASAPSSPSGPSRAGIAAKIQNVSAEMTNDK